MRIQRAICLAGLALALIGGCNKGGGDSLATAGGDGRQNLRPRSKGPTPEDLHPTVLVRTSLGEITLRLDAQHAPITVDNFLRYAGLGYYAGTIFHQVDAGFILLGGGLTNDLQEKPAQVAIRNEAHNGLKNRRGTIAMSRQPDVVDSSTCQFFFNLADNPSLDHQARETPAHAWNKGNVATAAMGGAPAQPAGSDLAKDYGYCVFGEVIAGQEVLERIAKVEVRAQGGFDKVPVKPVVIEEVRRVK